MYSDFDLHLHTVFSDGSDTPAQLLEMLKSTEIKIFAVCDHDTADGCKIMSEIVPHDINFISGIEFSCKTEYRKCHILGLGIDYEHPKLEKAVEEGRKLRANKLLFRLEHLKSVYNIAFSDDEIVALMKMGSVGKPHLANLIVKYGFADNIQEAIKTYLNIKSVNDRLDAEFAVDAIKASGGIAVWAHPLGGEGERRLTADEFDKQLELLLNIGIEGLECYYSRYTAKEAEFLVSKANEHGLLISGGSDYHGSNKNISPGELSADGSVVTKECITILQRL